MNIFRKLGFATVLFLGSVSSANAATLEVSGVFINGTDSLADLMGESFSFQLNYDAAAVGLPLPGTAGNIVSFLSVADSAQLLVVGQLVSWPVVDATQQFGGRMGGDRNFRRLEFNDGVTIFGTSFQLIFNFAGDPDTTVDPLSVFPSADRLLGSQVYLRVLQNGFLNLAEAFPTELTIVPIPPAVWLFGSGLLGLIGVARRKVQA